ncbi:MAG: ribosomal RNA small subunit methyltransferase A [Phycisphaerales bacterium]|nr:ribosomal RNA small subunit methyltransferase A [Phycisphaerales bacterium]
MQTLSDIKRLLDDRGLAPKKSLGQNFLIDHNLIKRLVDASGAQADDIILEVGPGTGTLTEELLARGCRVVACELDDHLSAMLRERAAAGEVAGANGRENLTVIHADCLGPDRTLAPVVLDALRGAGSDPRGFRLVANLPYSAATPLMTSLLLGHPDCPILAVTIQKEVADRLLAAPRTKEYGGLSVVAQALCTVQRLATLPRECFWPRPDVTSAMILLTRRQSPLSADPLALSAFCRTIFAQRRKQLGSALGRAAPWPADIRPEQRAEELSVEQIERLRLALIPIS